MKQLKGEKELSGKSFAENEKRFQRSFQQPLILALNSAIPDLAIDLLERGADPSALTTNTWERLHYRSSWETEIHGTSALDIVVHNMWGVRKQLYVLYKRQEEGSVNEEGPKLPADIDAYCNQFPKDSYEYYIATRQAKKEREQYEEKKRAWEEKRKTLLLGVAQKKEALMEEFEKLKKIRHALLAKGAKSFYELHPDVRRPGYDAETALSLLDPEDFSQMPEKDKDEGEVKTWKTVAWPFDVSFDFRGCGDITQERRKAYLEL